MCLDFVEDSCSIEMALCFVEVDDLVQGIVIDWNIPDSNEPTRSYFLGESKMIKIFLAYIASASSQRKHFAMKTMIIMSDLRVIIK
jgi:hypothetical protein